MAFIPYSRVNPLRAFRDAVILEIPAEPFPRRLLCSDAYCIEPKCDCEIVHLRFAELPAGKACGDPVFQPSDYAELMTKVWEGETPLPQIQFERRGKRVNWYADKNTESHDELIEAACGLITAERMALFAEHYRETRAWGAENWWRDRDWTQHDLGVCVGWREVYPATPYFEFIWERKHYRLIDYYCAQPACPCMEAVFGIERLHRRGRKAVEVGGGRVSLERDSGGAVFTSDSDPAPAQAAARRILEAFLASRPALLEILRERKERMREFGAFALEQKRKKSPSRTRALASGLREGLEKLSAQPAAPALASGALEQSPQAAPANRRPGRNDPCPCGSGRKYKRCCGRL